jgi:hypothetical protein
MRRPVDHVEATRGASAGLGEDLRLCAEIVASGLELEDELIQLTAFRSGRRAFGRIARPSMRRT